MTTEQELLQRAVTEINILRRQNELMSAKLEMFDKCVLLLHTSPNYPSQGMSPDLVWEIQKSLDKNQD